MAIANNSGNVFFHRAKVLLEGVEVPYANVSVSYGITDLPSCTITLPGASLLRNLPPDTKVLVLYKEPQASESDPWYVMFDGEFNNISYSIDSNGAYMTIAAIHASSFLKLLQVICQEACYKLTDMSNIAWGGKTEISSYGGQSQADITIFEGLFNDASSFKSMAELIYTLTSALVDTELFPGASTKFYNQKLVQDGKQGYKVVDRICGIGDTEKTNRAKIIASVSQKLSEANQKSKITASSSSSSSSSSNNTTKTSLSDTSSLVEKISGTAAGVGEQQANYDTSNVAVGASGTNFTSEYSGGSFAVNYTGMQEKALDGMQRAADIYKDMFGEDLLITSAVDSTHADGAHSHGNGWKIDCNSPTDKLDSGTDKTVETANQKKFREALEAEGIVVINEFLPKNQTSNTTGGHFDLDFTNYKGSTTFKGFNK